MSIDRYGKKRISLPHRQCETALGFGWVFGLR
jgi:hypothetical protein